MSRNVSQTESERNSGSLSIDLERIADFGEDALLVIDRDYRVHFANLVMRQRLVTDDEAFLEKRCYEAFEGRKSPCTYPLWKCPLTRVLNTGNPVRIIHVDYSPLTHTAPKRYVELIMYPLRDSEGNINGFTEIRRDVTAERGLESYMLRQHHHLQALNRISSAVSGLWDLDEILRVSLDGVLEIIDGTIGGILLLDEETRKLRYRVHRGLSEAYVRQIQLSPGEGIAGRVAQSGTPTLVEDISRDPRTANPDLITTEGLKGFASVPLKAKDNVVGVMNVASHEPGQFGTDDLYLLDSIGYQVGTAIEQARLYHQLDRAKERYRSLLQYSLTAQEEAQKRIARELHDETSQVITSLTLNIQALRSMVEAEGMLGPRFVTIFDRTQNMAAHAGSELSRMMKKLRPTLLDELGMASAINRYARDTLEPLGIDVKTRFAGIEDHSVPPEVEVTMFRISQGVIGNIREHSEAKNIRIELEVTERDCKLAISDDGKGFDPERVIQINRKGKGAGLLIIKERANLVGGAATIDSAPDQGTCITIRIPLGQEEMVYGQSAGAGS